MHECAYTESKIKINQLLRDLLSMHLITEGKDVISIVMNDKQSYCSNLLHDGLIEYDNNIMTLYDYYTYCINQNNNQNNTQNNQFSLDCIIYVPTNQTLESLSSQLNAYTTHKKISFPVCLLDLIEQGYVNIGQSSLYMLINSNKIYLDVTERGTIIYNSTEYCTPNYCAMNVYTSTNTIPKKDSTGWTSIFVSDTNQPLNIYRDRIEVNDVYERNDIIMNKILSQADQRRKENKLLLDKLSYINTDNNENDIDFKKSLSPRVTLLECEHYNTIEEQPFKLIISSHAIVTMDCHAHMEESEVIGYLAGNYNSNTKELQVIEAYPCRRMNDGRIVDVEMDTEDSIYIESIIKLNNLSIIGWYHSHPLFSNQPSVVDVKNQADYEGLFYKQEHNHHNQDNNDNIVTPFIGAIISPFWNRSDNTNTNLVSDIRYFITRKQQPLEPFRTPMELNATLLYNNILKEENLQHWIDIIESSETKEYRINYKQIYNKNIIAPKRRPLPDIFNNNIISDKKPKLYDLLKVIYSEGPFAPLYKTIPSEKLDISRYNVKELTYYDKFENSIRTHLGPDINDDDKDHIIAKMINSINISNIIQQQQQQQQQQLQEKEGTITIT